MTHTHPEAIDYAEHEAELAAAAFTRAEKCHDLGPRIPLVQHERPTCQLRGGHEGAHRDENGFEWPRSEP